MFVAKPLAEAAGFKFWKPIVWDKEKIGMGYHYRSRYELVLFFEKGKRKLADLGVSDVIRHPRISRGYPAEKPAEVSEVFIRQSTLPGATVADPFMGSGSVGVAALRLGRRFIGTDISPSARELTEQRLSAEVGASPTARR
jgi:site-specific DNA-methyltransferase (adenine-specific)